MRHNDKSSLARALTVVAGVIFGTQFIITGVRLATPLLMVCVVRVRERYVERALEGVG